MARPVSYGTPGGRSRHYFFPRPAYALVMASLLGAAILAVMLMLMDLGGRKVDLLRVPLMPGALTAQHSFLACEACHAPLKGATNLRCQRCHDESGPGRMTYLAHAGRHAARFSTADASPAEAPAERECVACHREHRGREAEQVERDDAQCVVCHGASRLGQDGPPPKIKSLEGHPEFAVRRRETVDQVTRLSFSHKDHVPEVRAELSPSLQGRAGDELCARCHQMDATAGRAADLESVDAVRDCFRCHNHDKHLKVKPAPVDDLLKGIGADGSLLRLACGAAGRDFRCAEGAAERTSVVHKDPWVMLNVRRLRRELYPEEHAREVARLRERLLRLRRRLYLAERPAGLPDDELQRRRQTLVENLRDLDARIRTHQARGVDPKGGLGRVEEVLSALRGAQDPGADALQAQLLSVDRSPGPLSETELQRRRDELLDLLDAIAAAPPADDATRRRADVLRARLYAVRAGDVALVGLRRAREQRAADLARVEDELRLRRRPDLPRAEPDTGLGRVSAALEDTTRRLRELTALQALPPVIDPARRARKEASLEALTGRDHQSGCAKCHRIDKGTFGEPVLAAEPVLTLARFTHARHLRAAFPSDWASRLAAEPLPAAEGQAPPARSPSLPRCAYCHGDMERSELSAELHVPPIADCRACHAPGLQRQDCQLCHLYHPPAPRRP
jgi:predicted CXXCH cytochrome family protein